MKTDKQWAKEALRSYVALSPSVRESIEVSVARIIRHVRREMNLEAATAIENLELARRALQ